MPFRALEPLAQCNRDVFNKFRETSYICLQSGETKCKRNCEHHTFYIQVNWLQSSITQWVEILTSLNYDDEAYDGYDWSV
jgi:hypothetical protein